MACTRLVAAVVLVAACCVSALPWGTEIGRLRVPAAFGSIESQPSPAEMVDAFGVSEAVRRVWRQGRLHGCSLCDGQPHGTVSRWVPADVVSGRNVSFAQWMTLVADAKACAAARLFRPDAWPWEAAMEPPPSPAVRSTLTRLAATVGHVMIVSDCDFDADGEERSEDDRSSSPFLLRGAMSPNALVLVVRSTFKRGMVLSLSSDMDAAARIFVIDSLFDGLGLNFHDAVVSSSQIIVDNATVRATAPFVFVEGWKGMPGSSLVPANVAVLGRGGTSVSSLDGGPYVAALSFFRVTLRNTQVAILRSSITATAAAAFVLEPSGKWLIPDALALVVDRGSVLETVVDVNTTFASPEVQGSSGNIACSLVLNPMASSFARNLTLPSLLFVYSSTVRAISEGTAPPPRAANGSFLSTSRPLSNVANTWALTLMRVDVRSLINVLPALGIAGFTLPLGSCPTYGNESEGSRAPPRTAMLVWMSSVVSLASNILADGIWTVAFSVGQTATVSSSDLVALNTTIEASVFSSQQKNAVAVGCLTASLVTSRSLFMLVDCTVTATAVGAFAASVGTMTNAAIIADRSVMSLQRCRVIMVHGDNATFTFALSVWNSALVGGSTLSAVDSTFDIVTRGVVRNSLLALFTVGSSANVIEGSAVILAACNVTVVARVSSVAYLRVASLSLAASLLNHSAVVVAQCPQFSVDINAGGEGVVIFGAMESSSRMTDHSTIALLENGVLSINATGTARVTSFFASVSGLSGRSEMTQHSCIIVSSAQSVSVFVTSVASASTTSVGVMSEALVANASVILLSHLGTLTVVGDGTSSRVAVLSIVTGAMVTSRSGAWLRHCHNVTIRSLNTRLSASDNVIVLGTVSNRSQLRDNSFLMINQVGPRGAPLLPDVAPTLSWPESIPDVEVSAESAADSSPCRLIVLSVTDSSLVSGESVLHLQDSGLWQIKLRVVSGKGNGKLIVGSVTSFSRLSISSAVVIERSLLLMAQSWPIVPIVVTTATLEMLCVTSDSVVSQLSTLAMDQSAVLIYEVEEPNARRAKYILAVESSSSLEGASMMRFRRSGLTLNSSLVDELHVLSVTRSSSLRNATLLLFESVVAMLVNDTVTSASGGVFFLFASCVQTASLLDASSIVVRNSTVNVQLYGQFDNAYVGSLARGGLLSKSSIQLHSTMMHVTCSHVFTATFLAVISSSQLQGASQLLCDLTDVTLRALPIQDNGYVFIATAALCAPDMPALASWDAAIWLVDSTISVETRASIGSATYFMSVTNTTPSLTCLPQSLPFSAATVIPIVGAFNSSLFVVAINSLPIYEIVQPRAWQNQTVGLCNCLEIEGGARFSRGSCSRVVDWTQWRATYILLEGVVSPIKVHDPPDDMWPSNETLRGPPATTILSLLQALASARSLRSLGGRAAAGSPSTTASASLSATFSPSTSVGIRSASPSVSLTSAASSRSSSHYQSPSESVRRTASRNQAAQPSGEAPIAERHSLTLTVTNQHPARQHGANVVSPVAVVAVQTVAVVVVATVGSMTSVGTVALAARATATLLAANCWPDDEGIRLLDGPSPLDRLRHPFGWTIGLGPATADPAVNGLTTVPVAPISARDEAAKRRGDSVGMLVMWVVLAALLSLGYTLLFICVGSQKSRATGRFLLFGGPPPSHRALPSDAASPLPGRREPGRVLRVLQAAAFVTRLPFTAIVALQAVIPAAIDAATQALLLTARDDVDATMAMVAFDSGALLAWVTAEAVAIGAVLRVAGRKLRAAGGVAAPDIADAAVTQFLPSRYVDEITSRLSDQRDGNKATQRTYTLSDMFVTLLNRAERWIKGDKEWIGAPYRVDGHEGDKSFAMQPTGRSLLHDDEAAYQQPTAQSDSPPLCLRPAASSTCSTEMSHPMHHMFAALYADLRPGWTAFGVVDLAATLITSLLAALRPPIFGLGADPVCYTTNGIVLFLSVLSFFVLCKARPFTSLMIWREALLVSLVACVACALGLSATTRPAAELVGSCTMFILLPRQVFEVILRVTRLVQAPLRLLLRRELQKREEGKASGSSHTRDPVESTGVTPFSTGPHHSLLSTWSGFRESAAPRVDEDLITALLAPSRAAIVVADHEAATELTTLSVPIHCVDVASATKGSLGTGGAMFAVDDSLPEEDLTEQVAVGIGSGRLLLVRGTDSGGGSGTPATLLQSLGSAAATRAEIDHDLDKWLSAA